VTRDLRVTLERRVVDFATVRLDPGPFDTESNAIKTQIRYEVQYALVVKPQSIGVARSGVATQRDGGPKAGGGLVRSVETAFDGVALEGDVAPRSSLHRISFARPIRSNSGIVRLDTPQGRSKEHHG
jgi:hypothetical protein